MTDEKNECVIQSFSEVNLKLDNSFTDRIRLVLQDVSDYECILTKWGIVIQYLVDSDDPKENIVFQWWNYYTIARFETKEHAMAFGNSLTKEDVLQFINFLIDEEKGI